MKFKKLINLKLVLLILGFLGSYRAEATILPGLYQTQCARGTLKEQTYSADQVRLVESFFQDAGCTKSYITFETQGGVQFEESSSQNIDFSYKKIFLTLETPALVDDFNTRRVCGFSNWQISVKQEITGLMCAIFNFDKASKIPSAGDVRYGIYLLKDNGVYYGKMTAQYDSSAPEKRPQEIDFSTEYIFQNPL
ncbi:MAG: hypothetical protein ACXVAX_11345 [Pseudobdellovibrio sp.]